MHRAVIAALIGVALLLPSLTLAKECYCVKFIREQMGVEVKGDAWTIMPNKDTTFMSAGDVLLTREGMGHASLVTGFEGNTYVNGVVVPAFIKVVERWPDGERCIVRTRLIPWGDTKIRGVYSPTTVIHSPLQ